MKFSKDLSFEEMRAVVARFGGREKADEAAKAGLFATMELLADGPLATPMVWRVAADDFLINTPEEVAAYCWELAALEKRNSRWPEAFSICKEQLKELTAGMADEIRPKYVDGFRGDEHDIFKHARVDDEGFWFTYKVWNKVGYQTWCVKHSDFDKALEIKGDR